MCARTRPHDRSSRRAPACLSASLGILLASGLALGAAKPPQTFSASSPHHPPAADPRPDEPDRAPPMDRDPADPTPVVQLAIVLDTSGSMSGLIEQAKAELWSIVNELAACQRDGHAPRLQVALFQYGTPSLGAQNGYIRRLLPFTTDLDAVSQELFSLTTSGGQEYCGWAIRTADHTLRWSPADSDLKMIVIAGNEPFTQGRVDFRSSVPAVAERGVVVNTIHCGPHQTGMNTGWYAGARLGNGEYSSIDHNRDADPIATPHDATLSKLSSKLNETYVAYGAGGGARKARQATQDSNAAQMSGGVAAERAASKASPLYTNEDWDLVDAVSAGKVDLAKIDESKLPEAMRTMSPEQRHDYVERQAEARNSIQARIKDLQARRRAHIAAERRERAGQGEKGEQTLGSALLASIREQARGVGLEFPETGATGPDADEGDSGGGADAGDGGGD